MDILGEAWNQREQSIYPTLFGNIGSGIYTLEFEMFKGQFGCESVDPTWLHYGVFKSPPNEKHNTWLYVSSGMSNPWDAEAPEEYSGLGMELILETTNDEPWAIELVQSLIAFNILLSVGRYGDRPLLESWVRIPQPIEPNITNLVLAPPLTHPRTIELVSGKVDFLQIVGITRDEFEYAQEFGSPAICERLQDSGVYPLTDAKRHSVLT